MGQRSTEHGDRFLRSCFQTPEWVDGCTWPSKQWWTVDDCPYTAFSHRHARPDRYEAQVQEEDTGEHAAYLVASSSAVQSGAGVVNWVRIPDPRLSAGGKERLGRRCAYAWGGAARRQKSASDAMLRAHDAAGGREGALEVVAALTLSMRHTLEFAVLGVQSGDQRGVRTREAGRSQSRCRLFVRGS
jgi:hypothetical protein